LIFPCKDYPDSKGESDWCAVVRVRISNPITHSPPSRPFEALIDTGASRSLFHSEIGRSLGISIERGEVEFTMGVSGQRTKLYLHKVSIYVGGAVVPLVAGFTDELPLAGLLGRRGFLENFKFTYDNSTNPPQFELSRISRV
jgi:Aspartyl protease